MALPKSVKIAVAAFIIVLLGANIWAIIHYIKKKKESYKKITTSNNWLGSLEIDRSVGEDILSGDAADGSIQFSQRFTEPPHMKPVWQDYQGPLWEDVRDGQVHKLNTSERGDLKGLAMKKMRFHDLDTDEIRAYAQIQKDVVALNTYGSD
jgi:hypothetical protein